ncbi:MAG TPA: hypothetical protein VMU39_20635 [Solirubrobacteraceae bacterium]|nr:hypothetical protein [Solirubrobacteraceae bacterium]
MRVSPEPAARQETVKLIYELLDAHHDTAELAAGLEADPLWQAHLEYLRALQCKGRELLAQMSVDEAVK